MLRSSQECEKRKYHSLCFIKSGTLARVLAQHLCNKNEIRYKKNLKLSITTLSFQNFQLSQSEQMKFHSISHRKCVVTHARVPASTLSHRTCQNKIKRRNKGRRQAEESGYGKEQKTKEDAENKVHKE